MHKVKFRDWEFEVDSELTRKTYAKEISGFSEGCACKFCENYRRQKDSIFPEEIITLFDNLGIDYRKESEVYQTHKLENGLQNYGGWFHFAGAFISGKECKSEGSNTFEMTLINENFSVSFSKDKSLSFFEKNIPLVQVEFEANIPWIIESEAE